MALSRQGAGSSSQAPEQPLGQGQTCPPANPEGFARAADSRQAPQPPLLPSQSLRHRGSGSLRLTVLKAAAPSLSGSSQPSAPLGPGS